MPQSVLTDVDVLYATGAFLTAVVIGALLQPPLIAWLRSRAILDVPSERSSHVTPTPRGGGLAVVAALIFALVLFTDLPWVIPTATVLFAALGAVDDFRGLSAVGRLAMQLALATATALLLAPSVAGPSPLLLTVLALVGWQVFYVNAFNFMDGVNGISALQAMTIGLAVAGGGAVVGAPTPFIAGIALAGAAISFLPFNCHRARIFLGDAGSYGLGAGIALLSAQSVASGLPAWTVLCAVSVYGVDVVTTLFRRARCGRNLWAPHREHTYQRLTDAGWSHLRVAVTVSLVTATASATSVSLIPEAHPLAPFIAVTCSAVLCIFYLALPGRVGRFRSAVDEIGSRHA